MKAHIINSAVVEIAVDASSAVSNLEAGVRGYGLKITGGEFGKTIGIRFNTPHGALHYFRRGGEIYFNRPFDRIFLTVVTADISTAEFTVAIITDEHLREYSQAGASDGIGEIVKLTGSTVAQGDSPTITFDANFDRKIISVYTTVVATGAAGNRRGILTGIVDSAIVFEVPPLNYGYPSYTTRFSFYVGTPRAISQDAVIQFGVLPDNLLMPAGSTITHVRHGGVGGGSGDQWSPLIVLAQNILKRG